MGKPHMIKILKVLADNGELTPSKIAELTDFSFYLVRDHLQTLEYQKYVKTRTNNSGYYTYFSLTKDGEKLNLRYQNESKDNIRR